MLCVAEIGMLVWGIITLVKGKFKLSSRKVAVGGPAYFIGVLLILPLPVAFVIGFAIGAAQAAGGGDVNLQDPGQVLMYAGIELAVVLGLFLLALLVYAATAKDPSTLQAPGQYPYPYGPNAPPGSMQDPGNPYSPPRNDPNSPRQF
jgi:hypothetical protein